MEILLVPIKDIIISEKRQRREFDPDALMRLATSIEEKQLLHPVVVGKSNGQFSLLAGQRRMKAIVLIWELGGNFKFNDIAVPQGLIPVVNIKDLSELERKEIEYAENSDREDLTWQEKAAATIELMELRKLQAIANNQPAPTTPDIAQERRGQRDAKPLQVTNQELIVGKHMNDPDVVKAPSLAEAFKVLKRKEQIANHARLAEQLGPTFTSAVHRLQQGDAIELSCTLDSASVDVIITDPPYGISAHEFANAGGKAPGGAHRYEDSYESWQKLIIPLAIEAFRVAKPQAHCYIFCDVENFSELKAEFAIAGWKVHRTPIIWHKPNGNRIPWPTQGPQRKHELIMYAVKGDKMVNATHPDVVTYAQDENLGHQAQKPVALYVDFLQRSTQPGDTVLDFMCGSGTIFPACHEMKCKGIGFEIDSAAYGLAAKRLGELK